MGLAKLKAYFIYLGAWIFIWYIIVYQEENKKYIHIQN